MTGPSPVEIKRHGASLALAIHTVRSDGRTVAPFKAGLFRVGDGAAMEVCSAADIQGMAARIVTKRQTAASKPRARTSERPAIPVPAGGREGTSVASRAGVSPATPICEKCGGPRSKESKALCANCYAQAGRGSYPARPTADAPDKFTKLTTYTAGPEQGAASSSPPPDDAPQADRTDAPTATPAPAVGASAGTDLCGCGNPRSHFGRCWFRRGYDGPNVNPTRRPVRNHTSRLTTVEAELAAVKSEFAAFKDTVKAAVADLVEHLGMGREHR